MKVISLWIGMLNQDTSTKLNDQKEILMEKSVCKDWNWCNKIIFTGIDKENQTFSVYRTQEMKVEYILNKLTKRYVEYLSPLSKFNVPNKNVNI